MQNARSGLRSAFVTLAMALLVASSPSLAGADDVVLENATAAMATDGSVRITLSFNGPAPYAKIIRAHDNLVHVVLVGARFENSHDLGTIHLGEVTSARLAMFAGIGMRVDFSVRDNVQVRTNAEGRTLIVHVAALHSDHEAALGPGAAAPPVRHPSPPPEAILSAVITLSYADVSEVAGALVKGASVPSNDVFAVTSPFANIPTTAANTGTTIEAKAPTYVSIPATTILPKDSPLGVRFDDHVAVDRRLNAILLTGTQAQIDSYKTIIAALDQPTPSVLLETQIVELTTDGAHDIGIDYAPGGTQFGAASFAAKSGGPPNASFSVSATLAALVENGQAKILARPRIIAVNNRPAAILSGEAVPILNAVIIPGGSGTIVENQIQYLNVGVSLQILPRIASDGHVTSQIFVEVSSIIDYVGNTPRIAVRQELTSAVTADAESLIVGGLLQQTEIQSMRRVPTLGHLPLIGQFFRDTSGTSQSTNLYVVITPHILTEGPTGASLVTPSAPLSLPTTPPEGSKPGEAGEPLHPVEPPTPAHPQAQPSPAASTDGLHPPATGLQPGP